MYGPQSVNASLAAIDAAARRGDRRLNVVVTILVDLTKDFRIKSFGRFSEPGYRYRPYDDAMRQELQAALEQVFARMVEHDMGIFILPHIDAGGEVRTWRNWVDFDPLESYAGYSYDELMIGAIVDALQSAVAGNTKVELALSGEMGTSLFRYPESYRAIIRRLRETASLEPLKIGFSLNHGGIAGERNPAGIDDIRLSDEKRREMQALIDECDFVGMSFYRPVSPTPTAEDFVRGIEHYMGEFQGHGLNVPVSKPMHFSEVGLGGGHAGAPTTESAKAVQTPWEGTSEPTKNPWRQPAMQKLRRQYHAALLDFLSRQPAPHRVTAAFFWSMGSWDPQGSSNGEFADPQIIEAIQRHNRVAAHE
jgi:hypothetical protein